MSARTKARKARKHGFGARLREARMNAGFSQMALLDSLGWSNVSNSRLSGYEKEARQPTIQDWERICAVLQVSPCWIVFGCEDHPHIREAPSK